MHRLAARRAGPPLAGLRPAEPARRGQPGRSRRPGRPSRPAQPGPCGADQGGLVRGQARHRAPRPTCSRTLRTGSDDDACEQVVELSNRGVAPQSIWDALFDGAGELLLRQPGIVSLHAVTTTNALHYAYQASGDDLTRRLLMLQNAAFLTLFRGAMGGPRQGARGADRSARAGRHRRRPGHRGRSRRSSPTPAATRWPRRARRWPTSRPGTSPSR